MNPVGLLRWALATSVAGLVVASGAPAQATAYRYWSYWLGADGAWTYSNAGPAYRIPADGTVEGWRFSVDGDGGGLPPRTGADFDTVCADTPAEERRKRVAVIVDPGLAEDAPPGQSPPGPWALCVSADAKATGYDVLRAAASVRVEGGLICAIGTYPTGECAVVVDEPEPEPKPKPSPSPEPKPTKTREPKPQPTKSTSSPPTEPTLVPSPSSTNPSPSSTNPSPSSTNSSPSSTNSVTDTAVPTADESPQNTDSPENRGQATPPSTPTPVPMPTPAMSTSEPSTAAALPADTPTPSVSLLAEPLSDPTDSGGGSLLLTGGAVTGIALLGGAAVIITRRRSL